MFFINIDYITSPFLLVGAPKHHPCQCIPFYHGYSEGIKGILVFLRHNAELVDETS